MILQWLAENGATVIISLVLVSLMALAVRYLWKTSKKGGCAGCSGCSKGCGGCCQCSSKNQMSSLKKNHPQIFS